MCLPKIWDRWEELLIAGRKEGFSSANEPHPTELSSREEAWRNLVRKLPVQEVEELDYSLPILQSLRTVFTSLVHLYVHSHPFPGSNTSVKIPEGIAVPLLQVSAILKIPPVVTYSDLALYNWSLIDPSKPLSPENVQTHTLFGTTPADEKHFYLISLRIELEGSKAIAIIRECNDMLVDNGILNVATLMDKLEELAQVIDGLHATLRRMRDGCDPDNFYNHIRPWFDGSGVKPDGTLYWEFETGGRHFDLNFPSGLAGATAGQSSLFQALDIFLGVDGLTHAIGKGDGPKHGSDKPSFLERMKPYMPFHHRRYLDGLAAQPVKIRDFVKTTHNGELTAAYNRAVERLKEFRSEHIRIVTLYIIQPARRQAAQYRGGQEVQVVGTGGSDVLPALKGIRDGNGASVL